LLILFTSAKDIGENLDAAHGAIQEIVADPGNDKSQDITLLRVPQQNPVRGSS
jgi:hypothetical protein